MTANDDDFDEPNVTPQRRTEVIAEENSVGEDNKTTEAPQRRTEVIAEESEAVEHNKKMGNDLTNYKKHSSSDSADENKNNTDGTESKL